MDSPPPQNNPPAPMPITQGDHFYGPRWNFFVDRVFIRGLFQAKELGMMEPGQDDYTAMIYATDNLNMNFEEWFDYNEGDTQMLLIRKRYRVFSAIMRTRGVHYDLVSSYMYYPPGVFASMCEGDPFARAYQHFGEPMWTELQQLFGEVVVPAVRRAPRFVDLSESTEVVAVAPRNCRAPRQRRPILVVIVDTPENTVELPIEPGPQDHEEEGDRRSTDFVNQRALSPDSVSTSRISGTHSPNPLKRVPRHARPSPC